MTREEVIKHLDSCDASNEVYAHFIVSINRFDLVWYGTDEQVKEFDAKDIKGQQEMLSELADEMHENFEYHLFGDELRLLLGTNN